MVHKQNNLSLRVVSAFLGAVALLLVGCMQHESGSLWKIERLPTQEDKRAPSPTTEEVGREPSGSASQRTRTTSSTSDYSGWHQNIRATYFDIALYPTQQTAWNDIDPVGEENPYYLALPLNDYVPGYKRYGPCKNRWVEIVNASSGERAFGQWEDVGPWFVNDVDYVFDHTGTVRPFAETHKGQNLNIYRESNGKGARRPREILNSAGIDLSPILLEALGIRGRGFVHWRLVDADRVADGPWKRKISTLPPHYRQKFYFFFGEIYRPWELTTTRYLR
jgi:hypothetical protein